VRTSARTSRATLHQLIDAMMMARPRTDGRNRVASGIRAKDGVLLKFEISTTPSSNEYVQDAAIMQQNRSSIRVKVRTW
jgi:hypothetical protein